MKLSPEAQAKMARKRLEYIHSMAEKTQKLNLLIVAHEGPGEDSQPMRDVGRLVHQLCGSAGLYGCHELQLAAQKCAEELRMLQDPASMSQVVQPVILAMQLLMDTEQASGSQ